MSALLAWLATYALHSTVLLAAIALLTAFVVRRDGWRDALWKTALVGGIATATLQLGLDVRPLVGRWELAAGEPGLRSPVNPGLTPGVSAAIVPTPDRESERFSDPGRKPGANQAPVAAEVGDPAMPWPVVLVSAWAAVSLVLLLRLATLHLRVHRVLRDRRRVTDARALGLLAELRCHAGLWRDVRLSMTTRCATPLALGTNEICVPEPLLALPTDELRSALAHELAHLARRDPLWQFGTGVLEAVFFFQPLNGLARRRIRDCAEHLSDDWAVRQTGSAVSLARCLASVASWVSPGRPLPSTTMAMAEGGSPLLRRVERLLEGRALATVPGRWVQTAVALVLIAVVLGAAPAITARPGTALPAIDQQGRTEVIELRNELGTLRERFRMAVAQARARGLRDYWIAYAFEGTVGPFRTDSDSQIPDRTGGTTLGDVMYQGKWDQRRTRGDVVPLFRMHADERGVSRIVRVAGRSYEQPAMADVLPVYCLDNVTEEESLSLLDSLVAEQELGPKRNALLSIIATHGSRRSGGMGALRQRELERAARPDPGVVTEQGTADALRAVFEVAMNDRDADVQQSATEALAKFPPQRAAPLLVRIAWEHPKSEVRQQAAETIGALPTAIALPLLDSIAVHHKDVEVARQAVEAMGQHDSQSAVTHLMRVLRTHPSSDVREEALDQLGRYGWDPNPNPDPNPDSDPNPNWNINPHSNRNSNPKPDSYVDSTADEDDGRAEFVTLRGGDFAAARSNARRFATGKDGVAVRRLGKQLDHEPLHGADLIRDRATWALARMENEELVKPLIKALGEAPDWRHRAYAAWALGVAADRRGASSLRLALRDPQWRVRAHAAYALGELRDRDAVRELLPLLGAPQWQVRAAAADNLGLIGDDFARPLLEQATSDRHPAVRDAAATAVRRLK